MSRELLWAIDVGETKCNRLDPAGGPIRGKLWVRPYTCTSVVDRVYATVNLIKIHQDRLVLVTTMYIVDVNRVNLEVVSCW